jgi:hypothetical protein
LVGELIEDAVRDIASILSGPQRRNFEKNLQDIISNDHRFDHEIERLAYGGQRDFKPAITQILRSALSRFMHEMRYEGASPLEHSLSMFKEMFKLSDLGARRVTRHFDNGSV